MNNPAIQTLLMVGLPYAAIALFIAGMGWRHRKGITISSLSSQILESRWLAWGTVPFHVGIVTLFVGHMIPLLFPNAWQSLVSRPAALLAVESIGIGAAVLTLAGLLVLLIRRVLSSPIRSVTTVVDFLVLILLFAQAALGLFVAVNYRWGSIWSIGTTTPYLRSVFILQPDPAFVAGMPLMVNLHVAGAWILLALIPFSRLVHLFALPVGYLARPNLRVIWATRNAKTRRAAGAPAISPGTSKV